MRRLNYYTLLVFAPILILTGVMGLITQSGTGLMSDAFAYDVFHIVFGVIGLGLVLLKKEPLIRAFNIGFGAIDLYQLVASLLHLFPEEQFRWKWTDDAAHLLIGVALIVIGLLARR